MLATDPFFYSFFPCRDVQFGLKQWIFWIFLYRVGHGTAIYDQCRTQLEVYGKNDLKIISVLLLLQLVTKTILRHIVEFEAEVWDPTIVGL